VAAAAGGVENFEFSWVYLRSVQNVDRELESVFKITAQPGESR
jgi:hypothetical protein